MVGHITSSTSMDLERNDQHINQHRSPLCAQVAFGVPLAAISAGLMALGGLCFAGALGGGGPFAVSDDYDVTDVDARNHAEGKANLLILAGAVAGAVSIVNGYLTHRTLKAMGDA